MRPRYESAADRSAENRIFRILREREGVEFRKLPMQYRLDAAVFRDGNLRGFAEIKRRTHCRGTYSTYLISLSKVIAARGLSQATGLKCLLFVDWTDELGCISFDAPYELGWGGRTDRNDGQDVEPVAFYPIEAFRTVRRHNEGD